MKPGHTKISIPFYEKHWIEHTKTGWQIRIATSKGQQYTIDCHFGDLIRTKDGRLKKKNESIRRKSIIPLNDR